jgi:spore coat protein H
MKKWLYSFLVLPIFIFGCTPFPPNDVTETPNNNNTIEEIVDTVLEDKRIYENDDPFSIVHLYVTILNENEMEFYDVNHWYDQKNNKLKSPTLKVIVQEGDATGPKKGNLGYGEKKANAILSIRGNSSRLEVQKSYKIKLEDSAGLWKGQTVFNLNKHVQDRTRVKNKLSFDYFQRIPELPSLRTHFVHLHIKDLTNEKPDNKFQSYGLYTHVEQVNERYLSSHGLNPYGQLYKVINSEFRFDESKLKLEDDPNFNKAEFEKMFEIKGDKDHSKLIEMLRDLNSPDKNINDIVDRYFDRDNLTSWLAVNILFSNVDTMSNNYYLYSPPSSEKWYFIPWDYDKAWGWHTDRDENIPTWQTSIARYWGTVLFNRFLKDSNNLAQLNQKIEELSTIIVESETEKLLKGYNAVVKPLINKPPDLTYFPINVKKFDEYYYQLVNLPEINKKIYYEQLEVPMPIFLGEPQLINNNRYSFNWENSYHLKGDELYYTFQLSKDVHFNNILIEYKDLTDTKITTDSLKKGRYFWRVLIKDSNGHTQIPFDYYKDEGSYYWGLKDLIIK